MFAPSLQWVPAAPVPHLLRYYGLISPLLARPGGLRSPLTTRLPLVTAETRRSPTFVGNPSESVPRARDSGGSTRPSPVGSRDAAFREANDVGIRNEN